MPDLFAERAVLQLLDVFDDLGLRFRIDQIVVERTEEHAAVFEGTEDHFVAEGAVFGLLKADGEHTGVVGDDAAGNAGVLAEQVGGLADVDNLDGIAVGLVDGLTRAGVDGGSIAKEHVCAFIDHGSGKLHALGGVIERTGIGGDNLDGGVDDLRCSGELRELGLRCVEFHAADEADDVGLAHEAGDDARDGADLVGVGQDAHDVGGGQFGGAVEHRERNVRVVGCNLLDGIAVLVARRKDHVIAEVAVADHRVGIGGLIDGIGVGGFPAAGCGGGGHAVVAGRTPATIGDAGIADHGNLEGFLFRCGGGFFGATGEHAEGQAQNERDSKNLLHKCSFPP
ncbi:hypothetical protein SDC9_71489 [bioreactor metagenome]|uniref:NAD-specific glutamate dehydrogenase n=1 Tax=bioreactor metagenome TaxID=1076179 RepID=A0A644Y946_9ZZZZ